MAKKPAPTGSDDAQDKAPRRLMNDPLDWITTASASAGPAAAAAPVPQSPQKSTTAKPTAPSPAAPPPKKSAPARDSDRNKIMSVEKESAKGWEGLPAREVVDLLSNPMMVADADLVIRYANEAAFRMFERLEDSIRQDLPEFRARDVVGKAIDYFHKNAAYQRQMMGALTQPHDGRFSIGSSNLAFRATPKHDAQGKIAFIFVEWSDRTAEVVAQAETASMAKALNDMAAQHMLGEIDVFIDTDKFTGVLRDALTLVNNMVKEHIATKKKVVACVTEMAQGNLDAPMERFNRKRVFLNDAIELIRSKLKANHAAVQRLLGDVSDMSRAQAAGEIDRFIDPKGYAEGFTDVIVGMNRMVEEHIATTHKVVSVLGEFGRGNFDVEVEQLPGKKAYINKAIELNRSNLKRVVRDIGTMAKELADGVLETSVDASNHQGEFGSLIGTIDTIRRNFAGVTAEIDRLSRAIVDGDLDVATSPQNFRGAYRQLIDAFDQAFESLNGAFRLIGQQAQQVSITVEQMSQSSQSLATNSQIQSSSVDQVSSSAEETDEQVKSNAAAATTASQLVTGASEVAEGGKAKINEMVQAMEGIRASSQDIAKIIKVIDEIAFQTNLLALNAAVEAARAGQHGRGFAVVAQEVRNLAGRSAKAARETSDLIEDASTRVQAGVKIADETSRAFVSIADDIAQVKTLVRDIATASGEQSRGVAQINLAIGEVAKSALSTSQQAEELAASAAEMQAATQSMLAEVGRFKLRKAPETRAPNLPLAGLPAELMAQIQAMILQQTSTSAAPSVYGSSNRDGRGYGRF